MGEWWTPPGFDIAKVAELWLVEGIFDAIALWSVGVHAAALLSCNNYPSIALRAVRGRTSQQLAATGVGTRRR